MSQLKSARNLPMYKGIQRTPQGTQTNLSEEIFAERLLIKTPREKTTNLPQWEKKAQSSPANGLQETHPNDNPGPPHAQVR